MAREIPVTFTAACVASIRAGRKTQARRVVKATEEPCPFGETGDLLLLATESAPLPLRVRATRRERLAEISNADLFAEGDIAASPDAPRRRVAFAVWWDEVHRRPEAKWAENPEVWVVEFEVCEGAGG
jgi:hypothetical protein